MLRSLLAVISGYLVFGISAALLFRLSGVDPHQSAPAAFVGFTIVYGLFFAVCGGYVTARIAPRKPMLHTAVVAGIVALAATASLFAMPQSTWTQLATLLLFTPATLLGGSLRR